jgi:hypothetical protein
VPRAGFWAIGGYAISFRRDGRWYADEEVIANDKIALLFSRHVQPDGSGGWVIDLGIDRQPVEVEDTALVVTVFEGDPQRGYRIRTNDGVEEPLDCSTLRVAGANVLYCDVDRGERGVITARFLRPAYYDLARRVEVSGGIAVIECHRKRYTIATSEPAATTKEP